MPSYTDLDSILPTPATGDTVSATYFEALRDNQETISPRGAWSTYTPTFAQGASTNIAKTVTHARYMRIGRLVKVQVRVAATAAGTSGSAITLSLPVAPLYTGTDVYPVGTAYYHDVGVAQYMGVASLNNSTVCMVRTDTTPSNYFGADPSFAVASTDLFAVSFEYEAAADSP